MGTVVGDKVGTVVGLAEGMKVVTSLGLGSQKGQGEAPGSHAVGHNSPDWQNYVQTGLISNYSSSTVTV